MKTSHSTEKKLETAVLVGISLKSDKTDRIEEYLDELAFLADTAGAKAIQKFIQKLDHPDPKTFVGKGKMTEITDYVKQHGVDIVIFDDELSPAQTKNIENILNPKGSEAKVKVIDRSRLILDIFALNARTAQASTQVELAQYQYLLPRLTKMWTHLEKQKGGIGMKGPGEKEIETDRRVINNRISLLKEELRKIERQGNTKRQNRTDKARVALIGYTNVGKSTIMNLLSKADILAENKLFSTLDSTVRKVVFSNIPFLLSDTVGFIRKLPHQLIECFKSTLDEVREADALIHVVDLSSSNYEEQMEVVNKTLEELVVLNKPTLTVFNKMDAMTDVQRYNLHNTYMAKENTPVVFISALKKINIDDLRDGVLKLVKSIHK